MGEEVKKISFGFSKLSKKTSIVSSKLSQPKTENKKVEFIDCLEGKSIKLKSPVECNDKPLVIPLKREIIDNINKEVINNSLEALGLETQVQDEHNKPTNIQNNDENDLKSVSENETLDEIAAREIIEDLNKKKTQEETHIFSVPLTSSAPTGEKESSLDDYENIPVAQFGVAMLRGMGWAPGKGIGKNEKLVSPAMPTLRPKGMGLGADKVLKTTTESGDTVDKELMMTKGSYVRVLAGSHKDCYGQIEGFDEESCRMIVKLSLKNMCVSLNEFMVQLVSKNEFFKNSKVINVGKYEKYKDDEDNKDFQVGLQSNDEHIKISSSSTERQLSDHKLTKRKSAKESRDKPFSRRSRSKSITPDDSSRIKSFSGTSTKQQCDFYSKEDNKGRKEQMSSTKVRHSCSASSDKTSGSSDDDAYLDRRKYRTKKKKPSSHRYKSRSRSRSPRDRSSHKRHKQRK